MHTEIEFINRFRYLRSRTELQRLYKIVSRETSFCIEGFPRSGNTFFVEVAQFYINLLHQQFNFAENCIHHHHDPGLIRFCLEHAKPVILLFRRPGEAIVSSVRYKYSLLTLGDEPIRDLLIRRIIEAETTLWLRFYDLYLQYQGNCNLCVSLFDTFKSDPAGIYRLVMSQIASGVDSSNPEHYSMDALQANSQYFIDLIDANSIEQNPLRISSPTADNNQDKVGINTLIRVLLNELPCYYEAEDAYTEICTHMMQRHTRAAPGSAQ